MWLGIQVTDLQIASYIFIQLFQLSGATHAQSDLKQWFSYMSKMY